MSAFNPFNYSLAELQKLVVELISVAIALAVLFVALDPGLGPALAAVAAGVFGVIGVFAAPNINDADATKAVPALAGSVIAVVALLGGDVVNRYRGGDRHPGRRSRSRRCWSSSAPTSRWSMRRSWSRTRTSHHRPPIQDPRASLSL